MPVVLDVNVLPRGDASRTRKLRDAFMDAYFAKHTDAQRVRVDLAEGYTKLPAFDEWDISAKFEMLYGQGQLDEVAAGRWDALSALTNQLHTSTLVVVTAPMWNFSIPWHLKRWIDCVVQGRLTFEYRDGAFHGLLTGRPAVLLTSRDGAYPPGSDHAALDFQLPYLKTILGLIGLGPFHEVVAEPMALGGPDVAAAALQAAIGRAAELAASL